MEGLEQLKYEEQLDLFSKRGMKGIVSGDSYEAKKQIKTVSTIGYYNLKSYAYPFYDKSNKKYNGISFNDVVTRYYRDKRLKQNVLQAIEDIEVTLNTKIAFYLGENYGAYGYKNFYKWCQNAGNNEYLNGVKVDKYFLEREKLSFFSKLQSKIKKTSVIDIKDFEEKNSNVFPPIWLIVNELTIGESIHILKLMSKSGRKVIADQFGCTVDSFISWLDCINLIRNICCHNGNLIDLELRTKPIPPQDYKNHLIVLNNGERERCTNKIALPILIISVLMSSINMKYKFEELHTSLFQLCSKKDEVAKSYGFKDINAINSIFNRKILSKRKVESQTVRSYINSTRNLQILLEIKEMITKQEKKLRKKRNKS